jgi:hypothetical protein
VLKQLEALAANGQPGECVTYHRGFLIKERGGNDAATTALKLAEAGQLLLFQRRHGPDDYEYIAVKASPAILKFIECCAASAGAVSLVPHRNSSICFPSAEQFRAGSSYFPSPSQTKNPNQTSRCHLMTTSATSGSDHEVAQEHAHTGRIPAAKGVVSDAAGTRPRH